MLEIFFFCLQEIIRKYTEISGSGNKHAALASALGFLTWEKPLYSEFQQLARYSFSFWLEKKTFNHELIQLDAHKVLQPPEHQKNVINCCARRLPFSRRCSSTCLTSCHITSFILHMAKVSIII